MDLLKLEQKLLATARSQPPRDTVPYAFEKRIMARIREVPAFDAGSFWARALLRAAAPCVALALLLSAWSLLAPSTAPSASGDLVQDMDNTVLAVADLEATSDTAW